MNANSSTVFVVDDDPGMRRSTIMLLEAANFDVEEFDSAEKFLEAVPRDRPGCLILDLHLQGMHGIELVERLRSQKRLIPIIVVSGTGTIPLAVKGMKLGVLDFLVKPVESDAFIAKVRSALELDEKQRATAVASEEVKRRIASLTPRERELLTLLVAGNSNKQIAYKLGLSIKTVENHRANLMQKMDALNVADLTRMSVVEGGL